MVMAPCRGRAQYGDGGSGGAMSPALARVPRQADAGGEAVLLARLAAGDERALAMVYDQHADKQPQRVDLERGSLRAFLGVVTHHRAVDEIRRVTRRSEAEARAQRGDVVDDGHEGAVLEAAAQDWRRQRLEAMLDKLPADQRAALELAYFDGRTYREVASILGIPEGTAKSRLRLALARLRTMIGPENARAWT